ncbi:MAG: hypothetical protein MI866_11280, partial [Bacteroidales bacterium]|nr:hypothetical protein [Bacteroidales bacterium]
MAYNHGTDLLISREVSLVNGQGTQLYNGGEKKDYAYEVSLGGTPIRTKDWGLRLNANATWLQEEIIAGVQVRDQNLNVLNYLNGSIYQTGFPVDGFYSYMFGGLDENGYPTYTNLENEGESLSTLLGEMLTYSGRRSPQVYGGFNAQVSYKRLTLNASFSYQVGHHVRLLNLYGGTQNMPLPTENLHADFNKRWRQPGDEEWAVIPTLSNHRLQVTSGGISEGHHYYGVESASLVPSGSTGWTLYDLSDIRVVRGDHIRWQALTLNYNFPAKSIESLGLSNLTISGSMSNLAVWAFDKRLRGQDPVQVQGVGMPMLPTYTFALNIGF